MRDLNVLLSPHAESLLEDIVLGIAKALSVEEKIESDILNLESKMHIVKISDYETNIYGNDEQIELYNSLQVARQKAIEKRERAESDFFYAERKINKWKGYILYKKYTKLGSGEDK